MSKHESHSTDAIEQASTAATDDHQLREQPAIGLVATDDVTVIENVIEAKEHGLEAIVCETATSDPAIGRMAHKLGEVVFEMKAAEPTRNECQEVLRAIADVNGASGIILPQHGGARVDVNRSLAQADGEFVIPAVTEKGKTEPEVLVAIPSYNEEAAIGDVVRGALPHADEVLVIDDGSTDDTVRVAKEAGATVIQHERNKGYGGALNTAFAEAADRNAEHLVILDGDGQHDPSDIPDLVDMQTEEDVEIVIGSRFAEGAETKMPLYRRFGVEMVNVLTNFSMGVVRPRSWVDDTQSGFRVYDSQAIESLNGDDSIGDGMSASTDILHHGHRHSYSMAEVGTTINYDVDESSTHGPVSHGITLVMNILRTVEHERPITVLGIPGFLSAFVGVGFGYLTFSNFINSGVFPLGLAVTSVFFALAGIFAAFTAIILHSLNTHLE